MIVKSVREWEDLNGGGGEGRGRQAEIFTLINDS